MRINRLLSALSSARSWKAFLMFLAVLLVSGPKSTKACPFCAASAQTLRQEMASMDVVALGELIPSDETDINGAADFRIVRIWRGDDKLKKDANINAPYFGPGKSSKNFLLMGVGTDDLLWSSPLPITPETEKYLQEISTLSDDPIERLKYYLGFLEHAESMLARDAYDEFAQSPYDEVKKIRDSLPREKILGWVKDSNVAPDRKRLYYTLLGICGQKEDAALLESQIRLEPESGNRPALDALVGCYLTIKGEAGLPLIEEMFLRNAKSVYADTYSAVMALRFHGTEGGIIPRQRVLQSMQIMLERQEFADLVIPDLARWEDWTQIDRLVQLFKDADDTTSWVRVPVVNYLRACPLPEAKEKLVELEKIDPKSVKRASTFFPIPQPASKPKAAGANDSSFSPPSAPPAAQETPQSIPVFRLPLGARGQALALSPVAVLSEQPWLSTDQTSRSVNPSELVGVAVLASSTLALIMWMIVAGAERNRSASQLWITVRRLTGNADYRHNAS